MSFKSSDFTIDLEVAVEDLQDDKVDKGYSTNPSGTRCAYVDSHGELTYSSNVTSTEIDKLNGITRSVKSSTYAGQITSAQSWSEGTYTTFNFDASGVIGCHSGGVTEVGTTSASKSYRVLRGGYYLIGCTIGIDGVTINDDTQKAYVRAVVRFKKSGSSSWDTIQGWRLYFYDNNDQVEVLTYRYLDENDEVQFGIQHGGSEVYQTGNGSTLASDVSRAFIAPTMVL